VQRSTARSSRRAESAPHGEARYFPVDQVLFGDTSSAPPEGAHDTRNIGHDPRITRAAVRIRARTRMGSALASRPRWERSRCVRVHRGVRCCRLASAGLARARTRSVKTSTWGRGKCAAHTADGARCSRTRSLTRSAAGVSGSPQLQARDQRARRCSETEADFRAASAMIGDACPQSVASSSTDDRSLRSGADQSVPGAGAGCRQGALVSWLGSRANAKLPPGVAPVNMATGTSSTTELLQKRLSPSGVRHSYWKPDLR